MAVDQAEVARLTAMWRTVRIMEAEIRTNTNSGQLTLIPMLTGFARVPESLLLLFAVSVLEDALVALRRAGAFECRTSRLAALMAASRDALPWRDYLAVENAKLRRDGVAHRHELLKLGECAKYLDHIASELLAWKAIEHDFKGNYKFSLG